MFYSTDVRYERIFDPLATLAPRKEALMTLAVVLALVLVLSSAYLFYEWYTGDLREPGP